MTMDVTARWALPLLFAGQAQKELFHNEALILIDALLHGRAESADLATSPASPVNGACWIVAAAANGAWDDQDGQIACWTDGGWRFLTPRSGLSMLVADRGYAMIHDGSSWNAGPVRADGLYMQGEKIVGARGSAIATPADGTIVDANARITIEAILAALRTHGLIAS